MFPTNPNLIQPPSRIGRTRPRRATRFPAALAILLALLLASTAVAQNTPIVSTEVGEVPSTGGRRPGPIGQGPAPVARRAGVQPIAIQIEKAQIAADIEPLGIVDGIMENPTGPFVVSWYRETARLGENGNAVMAGHVDYWNVGPAVFYNLKELAPGDTIQVTGEDGTVYAYEVEFTELYENASAPIEEIVSGPGGETLTLITCGGEFEPISGEYLSRYVVRAARVDTPAPDAADEG